MSVRIDEVKGQVFETINKHFVEFSNHQSFSERTLTTEVMALVAELNDIGLQVKQGKLATIVTQSLCEIDKLLGKFDDALERGDYRVAAATISKADRLVRQIQSEQEFVCDAKIFTAVKEDLRRKRAKQRSYLDEMWRKAVVWHRAGMDKAQASLDITKSIESPTGRIDVALQEVVGGIIMLGMMDTKLDGLAKMSMKVLFEQLCEDPTLEPVENSAPKSSVLSLLQKAQTQPQKSSKTKQRRKNQSTAGAAVITGTYDRVLSVLGFLDRTLLVTGPLAEPGTDEEPDLEAGAMAVLGKYLWSPLLAVLKPMITKNLPSKQNGGSAFEDVLSRTATFEAAVFEMGLLSDHSSALVDHVNTQGSLRASGSRREELLQEAREILCSSNFNTVAVRHDTERGGLFPDDDPDESSDSPDAALAHSIYRLPACSISVQTQSLMHLAYRTLAELGDVSPDDTINVFYAVRDMFDLFRAVVPPMKAEALVEVPHVCAVFHNDCFYIAHHLLSLGYQFRSALPESFQPVATFVDMVPGFHNLGETKFVAMMQLQQQRLIETVQAAGGFGGTDSDERYAVVEQAISQLNRQLQQLVGVLKGTLPNSIFRRSIGLLLDGTLQEIIAEVSGLEDFSEAETHELFRLLMSVANEIPPIFEVKSISEVFEARMKDLVSKWKAGELALTAIELRGFIKALFENTNLRASCLAEIS